MSKPLLDWLAKLGRTTWRDISIGDFQKAGAKKLDQAVLGGPVAGMTPEQKILVLRFASGNGRIYGYRDGRETRIFHILWIDPKLKLTSH